jgi:hypothetical protein
VRNVVLRSKDTIWHWDGGVVIDVIHIHMNLLLECVIKSKLFGGNWSLELDL